MLDFVICLIFILTVPFSINHSLRIFVVPLTVSSNDNVKLSLNIYI